MKKNIIYIILFVFMILLNIFIGPSIRNPLIIINIISLIITSFYIIYCLIKKKEIKILDNKIDILVLLFLLLPFIPLIFNSHLSLDSELEIILQNISLFSMYVFIKNINSKENVSKLINILIFSSLPVVIIGIDRMTYGYIWEYLSQLDIFSITYRADRLISNFNYPNTLAIYLCSIIFLLLSQIKNNKKDIIYGTYIFVLLLFVILTKSRFSIILLFGFIILYLFNNKIYFNKIFEILLIAGFGICIYFILIKFFEVSKILKLVIIIFLIVLVCVLNLIVYKKKNNKINLKKLIVVFIVFIIFCIVYFIIGLNFSKPLEVEKNNLYIFKVDGLQYKIKIDISSLCKQSYNNFEIKIEGIDEYSNSIVLVDDIFKEYNGVKEYNFNIEEDIKYIYVSFSNYYGNELIINNMYVNNKKHIINYKILPNSLMSKIKTFSFSDKSFVERYYLYKDALKILKDKNLLTGCGYECWQYSYKEYQSYNYSINIMHSFIVDTLLNYGIIGILVLLSLIVFILYFVIKNIKQFDENLIGILFAITIIFIHSFLDFDMSFLLINYFMIILLSLFVFNYKDRFKIDNFIFNLVILIVFSLFIYLNIANYYVNYKIDKVNSLDYKKRYYEYKRLYSLYPFSSKLNYYKLFYESNVLLNCSFTFDNLENNYNKDLLLFINNEVYYEQLDVQKLYINYIKYKLENNVLDKDHIINLHNVLRNNKTINKFCIEDVFRRTNLLISLYEFYSSYYDNNRDEFIYEQMQDLKNIILVDYNLFMDNFSNYKKTGYTENECKEYIDRYKGLISDFKDK